MLELLQSQPSQTITVSSYMVPIVLFLAAQLIATATALVTIYVKVSSRLSELEVRVQLMEQQDTNIMKKLEQINEGIQDIRIDLENKKDRD